MDRRIYRRRMSTSRTVTIMTSKTPLDVAETTQVTEKLQLDVMNQLLQGLHSPHTQVLYNIPSVMCWVAYGNVENQKALVDLSQFLSSMVMVLRAGETSKLKIDALLK